MELRLKMGRVGAEIANAKQQWEQMDARGEAGAGAQEAKGGEADHEETGEAVGKDAGVIEDGGQSGVDEGVTMPDPEWLGDWMSNNAGDEAGVVSSPDLAALAHGYDLPELKQRIHEIIKATLGFIPCVNLGTPRWIYPGYGYTLGMALTPPPAYTLHIPWAWP